MRHFTNGFFSFVFFLVLALFSSLSLTLTSQSLEARPLTTQQKLRDFDQLESMIETGYGPLQYKKTKINLDFESLTAKFRNKIEKSVSNREFYYLILEYVASFHDGHFKAMVPTSRAASLPFTTEWVNQKVLIDVVSPEAILQFPYQKGDELVAMDGRPIMDVIKELRPYVGSGFDLTELRKTVWSLPLRQGAFFPVPSGPVRLTIQRRGAKQTEDVTLNWRVSGFAIDEDLTVPSKPLAWGEKSRGSDLDRFSIMDTVQQELGKNFEISYMCSGRSRIKVPKDATVLIEEPFVAYYHPTPFGKVGYLRLPHYIPQNEITQEPEYALRFEQYRYILGVLEKETVGLIIDQDHNCGGSVDYLEAIASLFFDRKVPPMKFELLANKGEFLQYYRESESVDKNTLDHYRYKKVSELIAEAWERGDFLTPLTSISGKDEIDALGVYSKPIVMLIDEMSGSGGDAFPSMMKGLGRARLFGTRTMGAGGHVKQEASLNHSQIHINMTKSLFFRPDGVAVENNGAEPDVQYTPTENDFLNSYQDYQKAYLKALEELVTKK